MAADQAAMRNRDTTSKAKKSRKDRASPAAELIRCVRTIYVMCRRVKGRAELPVAPDDTVKFLTLFGECGRNFDIQDLRCSDP